MQRLAVIAVLLFAAVSAIAQEEVVTLDQMTHPGLLVKSGSPGVFVKAPVVETAIDVRVRGIVARATVRQKFENRSGRCIEAIYVFPLADDATVDALRMKVGGRTITGEIREREEAKRVYEAAKNAGQQASLLEQQRPNLFTVSVASLSAGEIAEIELEYQQVVTFDHRFSLTIPLAIGPRYAADPAAQQPRFERTSAARNPVTLTVDLDAGIMLDKVESASHALDRTQLSATRVQLRPRDVQIASDRDFVLTWTPRLGAMPQSVSFSEVTHGQRYTLLMLFPPDVAQRPTAVLPRETIFIIDSSGSMSGPSMPRAQEALVSALGRLRRTDRFNVIDFDDDARALFSTSVPADHQAVDKAVAWVKALEADGGTEMLDALRIALSGHTPTSSDSVRQVVFITDGQVGNEPAIFDYIRHNIAETRLFTIGIGSAPNTYFMRNAARAGRGTFTQIGDLAQVTERMTEMLQKLESPVLSNVAVSVDPTTEIWPHAIPDLYAGEPLVVTMRAPVTSRMSGKIAATGWSDAFTLSDNAEQGGIAKIWARQKIDAVRDTLFTGAPAEEVKREIVSLGLEHGLVTEHTSLVAVDTTPAGVDPRSCVSELVPVNLPAGWSGGGTLPQTATHATLAMLLGLALLLAAVVVGRR